MDIFNFKIAQVALDKIVIKENKNNVLKNF